MHREFDGCARSPDAQGAALDDDGDDPEVHVRREARIEDDLGLTSRAPELERPYRTPWLAVTTAIYVSLATLIVMDLAWLAPATSGIGYLIVASGLPAYLLWRRSHQSPSVV